jgi:Ca-activated chloride channel family protein
MSFLHPVVLVALVAIPLLALWYVSQQRQRTKAAEAFANPKLNASVAPSRPRWRRHVPMLIFALALAILIVAAARPQKTVAVPINTASVMLVNDTSGSMQATDVKPSRLAASKKADNEFLDSLPASVRVGLVEFNTRAALLQSPTTDRNEVKSAIAQLSVTGGTAIGDAVQTAMKALQTQSKNGKQPPSAIVLLSDGASDVGSDPITAAQQAAAKHIPIYTVELGTPKSAATRPSPSPSRPTPSSSNRSRASPTASRTPSPTPRSWTRSTSASGKSLGTRRSSKRSRAS